MKGFNREKVSLCFWRTALVLVIVLAILLVIGVPLYFLVIKPSNEVRLDEFLPFSGEYSGYALVNPLEEQGALAAISFDGEKNGRGVFNGNVTVTVNGEKVYECLDCEFWGENGAFSLVTDGGWTPDMDHPRDTKMEATIWVDQDWKHMLLIPNESKTEYRAFVAPAQTHDEAFSLYGKLHSAENN